MPIIDRRIYRSTPHSGRLKVKFRYTFTDDHIEQAGPLFVADQAAAEAKLLSTEAHILKRVQDRHARNAVDNDRDVAVSGEASLKQVAKQYLIAFMQEQDRVIALRHIKKIMQFITVQGWTAAQVKGQLNITDEQWTRIVARRDYLLANEQLIADSANLESGDLVGDV